MTGRVIDDQPTIDYILKLHNEVRSKIARGRCDQPKAGCMWPLVNIYIFDLTEKKHQNVAVFQFVLHIIKFDFGFEKSGKKNENMYYTENQQKGKTMK